MCRTIVLAVLVSLAAQAAAESPAPISAAFGNTIVSTYPDGRQAELYLAQSGTYTAEGRRGDPSNGKWSVRRGKLCLKQARPIPAPFAFCTIMPQSLSTDWSARAVTGESIRVKLVKGHFAPPGRPA